MGRGAYEHNYVALDLAALRAPHNGSAPVAIPFQFEQPAQATGTTAELFRGDNLALAI